MPIKKLVQSTAIPRGSVERLSDTSKFQFPDGGRGFNGYCHFQDPTLLPFNVLTYPSSNCTMPNYDKVVPDKGKTLLGQMFTENTGIIGNKERFTSLAGLEMEVRVWASTDANLKDVIEVYFKNNRLLTDTVTGTFQVGEKVIGGTSGANGTIINILNNCLYLNDMTADFTVGETVTGGTSTAFADILSAPTSKWNQITELVNPLPRGAHEYYFDDWFDTKELSDIPGSIEQKSLQRLIWVNGYNNMATPAKGAVYSWTGGIGLITNISGNNIEIDATTSWRSLGFTEDALGDAYVIVNGVSYQLADPTELDTSSIDVTDATGVSIGDYAFSKIESDESVTPFDMCRNYHDYMHYGNWNQKSLYMSNGFNRDYDYEITFFQALDNDLVLDKGNAFTGTTQDTYHIVIDSVNPDIEEQGYTINTVNGLNDGYFDTSLYSGTTGATNNYKVVTVADFTLLVPSDSFAVGETIIQATTNATAFIVKTVPNGSDLELAVRLVSGTFDTTNDVVGQSSGATQTPSQALYQNWIQYYKNGTNVSISNGFVTGLTVPIFTSLTITLTDGLKILFGNYSGHAVGDFWTLKLCKGGHDHFTWQKNGGTVSSAVAITGASQAIGSDGLKVHWIGKNGHEVGDYWNITCYPSVSRAFNNFYYNINRLVGEGYIYRLPTNFWTMDTQEEELYVNSTYGEWTMLKSTINSVSVAETSETLSIVPLKQSGSNKVLYPYLTGHMNSELVYITQDKTLDMISRQIAVDKPQISYLSDPVRLDFDQSSFIGGRIKYHKKRLYITSPRESITHCYDFFRSYWQPLKLFPEVGLLSIIDNNLVAHSSTRNQSFTMFTNSKGDNGNAYGVEIRTPYTSRGMRWQSKFSNQSFIEGYIKGNPQLIHTVYVEPQGCGGIFPHLISAVTCKIPDRAPFGAGSLGSHSFGSDMDFEGDYFKELFKAYAPVLQWYFMSLGISCTAITHSWSILTMGMNTMSSPTGNQQFINPNNLPL